MRGGCPNPKRKSTWETSRQAMLQAHRDRAPLQIAFLEAKRFVSWGTAVKRLGRPHEWSASVRVAYCISSLCCMASHIYDASAERLQDTASFLNEDVEDSPWRAQHWLTCFPCRIKFIGDQGKRTKS